MKVKVELSNLLCQPFAFDLNRILTAKGYQYLDCQKMNRLVYHYYQNSIQPKYPLGYLSLQRDSEFDLVEVVN